MTPPARSLIRASLASLGVHGLLLLSAAWLLAVLPTLSRMLPDIPQPNSTRERSKPKETPSALKEIAISLIPETTTPPEEKKPEVAAANAAPSGKRQFILPNGALPEQEPSRSNSRFFSSRNMRAASTAAPDPTADPSLISQEGHDLPMLSLNAIDFKDGLEDSSSPLEARSSELTPDPTPPDQPANPTPPDVIADRPPEPSPPPTPPSPPPTPQPSPAESPSPPTTNPSAPAPQTAPRPPEIRDRPPELSVTPPPDGERPPAPAPPRRRPAAPPAPKALPKPGTRDRLDLTGKARVEEVKTRSRGGNTNLGNQASVDAEATPEGRYAKTIHEKVGLVWNRKMATIRGLTGVGTVEVEFDIDAEGRISNVQLVDPGKANPILEDVCLSAIIAAKLPPPPQELIDELRDPITGGRMRRRFTFHRL